MSLVNKWLIISKWVLLPNFIPLNSTNNKLIQRFVTRDGPCQREMLRRGLESTRLGYTRTRAEVRSRQSERWPACRRGARTRCRSWWSSPACDGARSARTAASAPADRSWSDCRGARGWWCSSPRPVASSTLPLDCGCPSSPRSSFRSPSLYLEQNSEDGMKFQ